MKTLNYGSLNLSNTKIHIFTARLVQIASEFQSDMYIQTISENKLTQSVDLKSILGLMSIDIANKDEFAISIDGADEEAASIKIDELIKQYI